MINKMLRRLVRIEGASLHEDIPIWVDHPDQAAEMVGDMIRNGEIIKADRPRCVHWERARCKAGTHEDQLARLLSEETTAFDRCQPTSATTVRGNANIGA